ncbi:T6SS effector amidase Tae4 family protein [Gimesia maris]|uniref:T6SS effector amidase Tae4 family protein n=1 Tax=Gimesia maris TaxID=122 RepID=UPI0032EFCD95
MEVIRVEGTELLVAVCFYRFNILQVTQLGEMMISDESKTVTESARLGSSKFWSVYLNYDSYLQDAVGNSIGGSIGELYGPQSSNSCAARVSYGLNYGSAQITPFSATSLKLTDHTYNGKAGDGKRYIVSAKQMAVYLKSKWGNPDHHVTTAAGLIQVINSLVTKCAIFATPDPPGGHGHSGVLKSGYTDPFVTSE